MQVNSVGNATGDTTYVAKELGKEDFLRLLVTQLRLQDPLEPIKEREFIAQLAQFSTLEGVNNLSAEMAAMADLQRASLWQSADQAAVNMIGYEVTLDTNADVVTGIVSGVRWHDGKPQIIVEGEMYDLGYIKELKLAPVNARVEGEEDGGQ